MPLRRLLAVAAVSLSAMGGLSACGAEHEVKEGITEGIYVSTGELKYQVQISRVLNPSDWEDRDYLKGISSADQTLASDEDWFGVFIRAFNETDDPHPAATEFTITDTTGREFRPVRIDTNLNPVAFRPQVVDGGEQLPLANSLGRVNSTQGGLILYKIPSANFENRPLEFFIKAPVGDDEARVTLDV
jgi:hypothetical protein